MLKKETEKKKFYLTTPIYYPSGRWHLGHCYTTVYGDALARTKRMQGYDVFYLTGTDEHGQKIEKRAAEANVTPKVFVDGLVSEIKALWKLLGITYDGFIRTTDSNHILAVQKIFKKLYDQGDIYKAKYKGKYCTPCESFWTETQAKDNKCPDCGRDVADAEEECYFFRLSKYEKQIRKLLTTTDFLQPSTRVNEMVNNFIDAGLEDLAVSRTSFKWGIPVEFDPNHIVYVWVDALSNYITALGYCAGDVEPKNGQQKTCEKMQRYWPADLHLMAKEIVRFHSIIWPALLMALELPLPKKVIGHGWLLFDGDKMSKSKGNVVDPFILAERYGVDSLRYYLLRAMPFGADGVYTNETFLTRINTDLCNDLGNLVKRTLAMAEQYFGGKIAFSDGEKAEVDAAFVALITAMPKKVAAEAENAMTVKALEAIFEVIGAANKYIDETRPWVLNKEGKLARLSAVLYNLLEAIRTSAAELLPYIPTTAEKIFDGLGVSVPSSFDAATFGKVKKYITHETDALFPRLDIAKELKELEIIAADKAQESAQKNGTANGKNAVQAGEKKEGIKMETQSEKESGGTISADEFFKTQLKVASVIACEKVENADKLLKLTLKVGSETRTVVSGIAKSYSSEEMVGKQVVLVSNLAPRKMRGIESQGMILCATDGDKVVLVSPEKVVEDGGEVC